MSSRVSLFIAAFIAGLLVCTAAPSARRPARLARGDLRWLGRVTFGVDAATVAAYRRVGREKFLDEQLRSPAADAGDLAKSISTLSIAQQSAQTRVRWVRSEQQRINGLPAEDAKQQARMAINQAGNQ